MDPEPPLVLEPVHDPRDAVGEGIVVVGGVEKPRQQAKAGEKQKREREQAPKGEEPLARPSFWEKT